MKHAAQMHDGKGAYQCQFCKKFFLRLNYLEMHRTYGCSANPQRARPLCDFCGRKFCQPQKLKVHIKRMHSDMADVLRDFQCKLCSKLLGSRAALQRHSKEVHSRNSAVVSCPRCQKLFQNRSNLKIHMLTHSGVRPFKCAENECNAAFTTKQCLQFHYKKDIFTSTFSSRLFFKYGRLPLYHELNCGGCNIKFDHPLFYRTHCSVFHDPSFSLTIRKYHCKICSIAVLGKENIMKHAAQMHDGKGAYQCQFCKKVSISCAKFSSFLWHYSCSFNDLFLAVLPAVELLGDASNLWMQRQSTASTGEQSNPLQAMQSQLDEQQQQQDDEERQSTFSAPSRHKDFATPINTSLIPSKGSKKWINDQQNQSNDGSLMSVNRDFITRLMMNGTNVNSAATGDDEDSSTILDVVDNHPQNASQYDLQQMHLPSLPMTSHIHQPFMSSFYNGNQSNASATATGPGSAGAAVRAASAAAGNSTSASLLVEAALNSVSNIIDSGDRDSCEMAKSANAGSSSRLEDDHELNSHMDVDIDSIPNEHHSIDGGNESGGALALAESAYHHHNNMSPLDNEVKLMKSLNNFQMSGMQQFSVPSTSTTNQIIMADSPSVTNSGQDLMHDNDIDVDTASTPRTMDRAESNGFRNYHQASTPSPRDISPGQDYRAAAMYAAAAGSNNHVSSPQALSRRNYQSEQNAMMSPTASPPVARYGFTDDMCRKREHDPSGSLIDAQSMDRRENHHMGGGSGGQLSSDEDSIVIAQNLSVNNNNNDELKMKMNPSMDLLYAKYEQQVNAGQDLADLRMKYNTNETALDVSDFRGGGANSGSESMSEIQGLDMSSLRDFRAGANLSLNRYHHHIYDILSEREQQQQSDHHQLQLQQQMMLQDQMAGGENESDQTTSVDLSRTTSYVVTSPPALPYSHPHSDMLRMVSLELNSNGSSGMIVGNNSHHGRSFLPSQIQHNSRESLSAVEHHRLLSTAEQHRLLASNTAAAAEQLSNPAASLASNHRLIVDPATHLLMEPNNRLLSSENNRLLDQTSRILADSSSVNRHMVPSRDFGAYQVTSNNYHHLVRQNLAGSSSNQPPSNYHPFPAYY
uniref:C2H2-type domain-containing protein n=2 Tax=Lutzomyia longipalpis TaxID=7200 RepID=A0A1B0CGW1_LUTLO